MVEQSAKDKDKIEDYE